MRLKARVTDILLYHHLLSPDLPHDLEFQASIYTNRPSWKWKAESEKEYYNAVDTDVTAQIAPQLKALTKQYQLDGIYENISWPISLVCHNMGRLGLKVDPSRIREIREKTIEEQQKLELTLPAKLITQQVAVNKRILAPPGSKSEKTGKPIKFKLVASSEIVIPWRSDKIVGEWLYGVPPDGLGLKPQKHIKTGKTTTDKYSLDRLHRQTGNPAIAAIKKLRSLDETLQTFTKSDIQYATTINPHYLVHGTNSGRLSSSGPNAQNIPDPIRCMYIPHKQDYYIVQCDYQSIENRLTAYFANDTERMARFTQPGFSEHKWACEQFFGIPMKDVEKSTDPDSPYSKSKHVVHGSNYGLGPRKMSMMYGVPEKEVKQLLAKWKAAIPKTFAWQETISQQAKKDSFLVNPFGRRRWFYTTAWFTESLSFLPQSTAADMILRAMLGLYYERIDWPVEKLQKVVGVYRPLPKEADLLVQVHDALVFQVKRDALPTVVPIIKQVMEQPFKELSNFSCPVSITFGPSWGEQETYNCSDIV